MRITLGLLRLLLSEAPVRLKRPQTPEEKHAFLELVKWAGNKMGAGPEDVQSAFKKAEGDDWSEALDMLSMYYVMKGIPFKSNAN